MIRESVLTEILEYVCAQLIRLKQRKDELTPETDTMASVEPQREQVTKCVERSAEPVAR